MATKNVALLIGKCLPSMKTNASKICVTKMDLDTNLLMYFKKSEKVYAYDPYKICKTGDIVLIEELPQKMSKLITHKVKEVVFPLGDIVDPISGKQVVASSFRDDIVDSNKLYGEESSAFNYEEAPPRGWQEGKRDFSDKETYYKYHEDGSDQPYAL